MLQARQTGATRSFQTRPIQTLTSRRCVAPRASLSLPSVDVEEGKKLLEQAGYRFLDLRPRNEYEREHLTKPPRSSLNVPAEPAADFPARLAAQCPARAAKLLVACADGGEASARAMAQLHEAGYSGAVRVEGGYAAWTKVFTTSGRRRPPPGRWVSSGREALKSGLNIPGVAESYDEGGNLTTPRYAAGWRQQGGEGGGAQ